MKSILALVCCLALASMAGAAKPDNNNNKPKKKQAAAAQQQKPKAAKPGKKQLKKQQGLATQGDLPTGQSHKQLKKQQKMQTADDQSEGLSKKQLRKQEKRSAGDTVPGVRSKAEKRAAKHFDLKHSSAKITKIEKVTFKQGRHIEGSQHWHGDNYVVFRNYRCSWHDRDWWHGHHSRIVLAFGGWYFWNAGFWQPAWGYDPGAVYPYDGPIYAYNDLPPDQVIANVQAELQAQGYYHGEVDGLLGPLTRAAIANYQQDRGLYVTSAIDQPTMASLGFT